MGPKRFDLFVLLIVTEWIFVYFPAFLCLQVERGSPKSCFLYLGEVLCDVNWFSVLGDHFQTPPTSTTYPALPDTQKESHTMLVYLLYMLVFLAKEEQILSQQVSPEYIMFHIRVRDSFPRFHSFFFSFFSSSTSRTPLYSVCWSSPPLFPGTNWTCPHTRAFWRMSAPTTLPLCCSLVILHLSCCWNHCVVLLGSTPALMRFHTRWHNTLLFVCHRFF